MENKVKPEIANENELLKCLEKLGYKNRTDIDNIAKVNDNLKQHLERLNSKELNNQSIPLDAFNTYVINKLSNNSIFDNAKIFRDLISIPKGIGNEHWRLMCFDKINFENNIFEFSHQITQDSREGNRGDVTLFLNGFPIVQIELKRVGIDIKEAFNQIERYKKQAFDLNIFKMIQLFIVSNDAITKYFANNLKIDKKFMFDWSDSENIKDNCSSLIDFATHFLNKQTLFKMLTNYMVLLNSTQTILTLRPYQYFAVEAVLNHIEKTKELNQTINDLDERSKKLNGYIWHATGSGKTLTSFKVAQLLSDKKEIPKVVFLVDRIDLNNQTIQEFKSYLGDNADDLEETQNSYKLAKQLTDVTTKIIVTTMQKIDRLLKKDNHAFVNQNKQLINQNFIFVIDECHRTQFGEMHKELRKTFTKARLIGFTGTPIFACNDKHAMTTQEIFGTNLHKYMMVNAINDQNVLKFHIEYIKGPKNIMQPGDDIEVEAIDKKGFFSSDIYIDKIVDYIYKIDATKTKNHNFKSMLVCDSIDAAVKYYWKFRKKYPDFKIATVFSKVDNNFKINEDKEDFEESKNAREELTKIIGDYNSVYKTNFTEIDFKSYSNHVQSNVSERYGNIQMVIVVRMLTTGFNAKFLNTIYLDRTLKDYEIIQTISRANRIAIEAKDLANVVSFRTFKKDVDEAITLYNDPDSTTFIFEKESLEQIINKINENIKNLVNKWPTYKEIKNETSEMAIKDFIKIMKSINKLLSLAKSFINFNDNMIHLTKQQIEEYRSVQKEIASKVVNNVYKEPILHDIDFELEVFKTDEINVDYILFQLNNLKKYAKDHVFKLEINKILESIEKSGLKSKAKLLKEFIEQWTQKMLSDESNEWKEKDVAKAYHEYRINNLLEKIKEFAKESNLDSLMLQEIMIKKDYENKPIEAYTDNIRDCIINKELTYLQKRELVLKIKDFILNIENDSYIEDLTQQLNQNNLN